MARKGKVPAPTTTETTAEVKENGTPADEPQQTNGDEASKEVNGDAAAPAENATKTEGKEKKEKKERTLAEKLKFYTTFSAASLAICTFSLFLFLIPFVIDPTVATINQDFIEEPVDCKVVLNKYILGEFRDSK